MCATKNSAWLIRLNVLNVKLGLSANSVKCVWLKIPQSCHFLRLWAEGWYGSDLLQYHHHLNHHQQFIVTKKPRSYFNDVLQSPLATIDFSQILKEWMCHQCVKYLGNWKPSALKSLIKLLSSSHIPQKISSSEELGQIYASVSLKTNDNVNSVEPTHLI